MNTERIFAAADKAGVARSRTDVPGSENLLCASDAQLNRLAAALVPDDFLSHKGAWRNALSQCARSAKGTDDEGYWAHELAAFDRAYAELGA